MPVSGLNHINIVTDDVDRTVEFYERVLGFRMERPVIPGATMPTTFRGCWLCDANGAPIIHLMGYNEERHAGRKRGPQTGPIDHVALACRDFDGMLAHCEALGVEHKVNDRKFGDLRQIFVTDPNDVMLELNFAGE